MSAGSFDTLTRRLSLLSVGSAGLATVTAPFFVDAKKKKRKKKGDVYKLCKSQVGQCTKVFKSYCGSDPDCPQAIACCSRLKHCDYREFFICLFFPPT